MHFREMLTKYWWGFIIPVLIYVIGSIITSGNLSQVLKSSSLVPDISSGTNAATSTINIAGILNQNNSFATALQQENFLKNYENTEIYGSGSFYNIAKPGEDYDVTISVSGEMVSCHFDQKFGRNLLLLRKGQKVSFTGLFTTEQEFGGGWYVTNCALQ